MSNDDLLKAATRAGDAEPPRPNDPWSFSDGAIAAALLLIFASMAPIVCGVTCGLVERGFAIGRGEAR